LPGDGERPLGAAIVALGTAVRPTAQARSIESQTENCMSEEPSNLPSNWTTSSPSGIPPWLKWAALAVVALAIVIPLIEIIFSAGLSLVWEQYVESIRQMTGLNKYLVALFSSLLFVPFYIGVTWSFSIFSAKRKKGYAILGTLLSVYYLALFIGTRDQNFDPQTGESTKWWCKGPDMRDKPGIDPVYGCKLRPLSPEEIERRLTVRPVEPRRVTSNDNLFDRATGEAKAWYTRDARGGIEAYDQPGFTKTGEELIPITPEIVREMLQKEAAENAEVERAAREDQMAREAEADRARVAAEQRQAESDRAREAKRRDTEKLRSEYDRAMGRARSETAFWNEMVARMERNGRSFRPDINVALDSATSGMKRCTGFVDRAEPESLRGCIAELNRNVAALEAAR